jgi:hypothetical protein
MSSRWRSSRASTRKGAARRLDLQPGRQQFGQALRLERAQARRQRRDGLAIVVGQRQPDDAGDLGGARSAHPWPAARPGRARPRRLPARRAAASRAPARRGRESAPATRRHRAGTGGRPRPDRPPAPPAGRCRRGFPRRRRRRARANPRSFPAPRRRRSPRPPRGDGDADDDSTAMPASSGLGRKAFRPRLATRKKPPRARWRATAPGCSRAASARLSARAAGIPARRCSSAGRIGFGRGAGGQAPSLRPITQSPSTAPASASSRPQTSTRGALRRGARKADRGTGGATGARPRRDRCGRGWRPAPTGRRAARAAHRPRRPPPPAGGAGRASPAPPSRSPNTRPQADGAWRRVAARAPSSSASRPASRRGAGKRSRRRRPIAAR